jgi:hypothetical protein
MCLLDETRSQTELHSGSVRLLRRHYWFTLIVFALLSSGEAAAAPCNESGTGTALERAAAGLGAGEWCDFDAAEPDGFSDILAVAPGDSNSVLDWSHGAQWDPVNRLWVFHGYGYAPVIAAMVTYEEQTNSWYVFQGEPFAPTGNGHDYDQTAVDPETGFVYYRPRLKNEVWRGVWNDQDKRYLWDTNSVAPISGSCPSQVSFEANGWAWDSRRKGIVMLSQADGGVVCFWDRQRNVWRKDGDVNVTGRYHQVAEWDPVHEIMWLNDYSPATSHWKIDAEGVHLQRSSPPFTLGCCGSGGAISTADPASGKFVVSRVVDGARSWWEYNVVADDWAEITYSMPPVGRNDTSIGGPVTDHRVIMYVSWSGGSAQIFLYRHAPVGP